MNKPQSHTKETLESKACYESVSTAPQTENKYRSTSFNSYGLKSNSKGTAEKTGKSVLRLKMKDSSTSHNDT